MERLSDAIAELPAVKGVVQLGYRICHTPVDDSNSIDFNVWFDGKPVAIAHLKIDMVRKIQYFDRICVDESHRRRRVATAIKIAAENLTGCKTVPGILQTDDARAWWSQPNRPR